jgi:hypothetical protein
MSHADEVMKNYVSDASVPELDAMILALDWALSEDGTTKIPNILALIRAERDRKRQIAEEEYRNSAK